MTDRSQFMASNNLVEIFFSTAKEFPDHQAIFYKNDSISYHQLASQVMATAQYFERKGIKKKDRVLVFVPMSIKLYQTVLALFTIGAIVVFVDEWADRTRLKKALSVVPIDAVIAPKKYIWLAYFLSPFRQIKLKIWTPRKLEEKVDTKILAVDLDDTALITFTTGSTGLPKAADRTHRFLSEQFRILKEEIGAQPNDNCLITLPIVLLSILGTGASGYIADFNQKKPEKLNAEAQLEFIKTNQITLLISSPFFVEKLAELEKSQGSKLRKILTGGAPVFPDSARKIQHAFPASKNFVAYGSTEAEPISSISMDKLIAFQNLPQYGLPVGNIHDEIELKIIKISEQSIHLDESGWMNWECNSGELGEIVVTGPHVLDRYFNSEEAFDQNKIVHEGKIWHRTGDSGRMIKNELYLNGRCSQLIKTDTGFLSLFIIEYQLSQISGVKIGTLINHIVAVEATKGYSQVDIKEEVETLQIPFREIKYLEHIPRDPRHFSKIDYKELSRRL